MLQEQLHGNGQSKRSGNGHRQPDDQQRSNTGGEFYGPGGDRRLISLVREVI
ncbi:hypothetical protein ABZ078_41065 [Streptomyces sp. NPDC006385]|uniref:hypothetical protein n=1 Tax=Streptomyces sp. NPDC006385 TaxID=3156761 RepID=UPI0033BE8C3F